MTNSKSKAITDVVYFTTRQDARNYRKSLSAMYDVIESHAPVATAFGWMVQSTFTLPEVGEAAVCDCEESQMKAVVANTAEAVLRIHDRVSALEAALTQSEANNELLIAILTQYKERIEKLEATK